MRKLLLSLACLFFMAGLVVAAEVTIFKFDKEKKEVTVKEGDAEKTYKISDKTKFSTTDKDGNAKEITYDDAVKGTFTAYVEVGDPKGKDFDCRVDACGIFTRNDHTALGDRVQDLYVPVAFAR